MLRVCASGMSDVGRSRRHNEDCFEIDPELRLYLVADGMGGHRFGEVASRMAVTAIQSHVRSAGEPSPEAAGGRRGDLLVAAFAVAHERVLGAIQRDADLTGMGTTLVGLLLDDWSGSIAHVGDSRAYRLRQERFELLTQDHTWVHEQVAAGYLSEEQARVHPLKNVVTRALGGEGEMRVDLRPVDVRPGDRYLLCSDGLTTMLTDEEIAGRLAASVSVAEICRGLVTDANARGGHDNVTVVVIAVEGEDPERE